MHQADAANLEDRVTGTVLLSNVSWDTYNLIRNETDDGGARLTYDHGMLEIEVPSRHHEQLKRFVGELVETSLRADGRDYEPSGGATWRQADALRGLEADECYHIQHVAAVKGKRELDLDVNPPPDLAIEIDVSSHHLNKMEIYKALGIPELWRITADGACEMRRRLDASPEYAVIDRSEAVPLLTAQLVSQYVRLREQFGHSETIRRFIAEVLAARP